MKKKRYGNFELVLGGFFGALGLILPPVFHIGGTFIASIFLPMFLPLIALACLVSGAISIATALLVPVLSSLLTGMPPIYPPILLIMVIELVIMCSLINLIYRIKKMNIYLALVIAALADRVFLFFAILVLEHWFNLPKGLISTVWVVYGLPGIALQLVFIPPIVKILEPRVKEMVKIW